LGVAGVPATSGVRMEASPPIRAFEVLG